MIANPNELRFTWKLNETVFMENGDDDSGARKLNLSAHNLVRRRYNRGSSDLEVTPRHSEPLNDDTSIATNVIQIQMKKWNNFGHFSCEASNVVGQESSACKWHIIPHHYRSRTNGNDHHQRQHQHRVHHHNRKVSSSADSSPLNNCQIIESSNAVVIKCADASMEQSVEMPKVFSIAQNKSPPPERLDDSLNSLHGTVHC